MNLLRQLGRLEEAGINVKVVSAISEELFDRQPEEYRRSVLPAEAYYDLMVISTGTRRVWPVRNLGPLTDDYSLTSDWENQWLTGGLEPDVIAEAHLDGDSIFAGIQRFASGNREKRISGVKERFWAKANVRMDPLFCPYCVFRYSCYLILIGVLLAWRGYRQVSHGFAPFFAESASPGEHGAWLNQAYIRNWFSMAGFSVVFRPGLCSLLRPGGD